jgi:DNA-binding transcriptional regulator YiaG
MGQKKKKQHAVVAEFPYQDPHAGVRSGRLEEAIGHEVRRFREKLNITISELAKAANLSAGMLSKIENGATSPSLSSLQSLS